MTKNFLLALISGLLLAFSWPTYGFVFFIFIGFVPLLVAEKTIRESQVKRKGFKVFITAYTGFLIWNIITTWWIWNSTAVGAIFALVVNSLLMAFVFILYHWVARRKPLRFSLIFLVAIWISFEKFHLNWDFSWPWLNLGNVFSEHPQWIQWYELTGTFGGSLWIWIINLILFNAVIHYQQQQNKSFLLKRILLSIGLVTLGIFSSLYRYYQYQEQGTPFSALLAQPNTNPYTEKYKRSNDQIAAELVSLLETKMDSSVQVILAPETVFSKQTTLPHFTQSLAYQRLNTFLSKYPKTSLVTGINLYKIYNTQNTTPSVSANHFTNTDKLWYESYNAAMLLSFNRKPTLYYKSKLVVGVEHFPFRSVLQPLLGDLMIDLGGSTATLTPQKEAGVFSIPNSALQAAPVICYESIYGEYDGEYIQKGANFFGIITNDSWWGNTQGHKQLLSYARLRAVEHRRSIARSANSGISAFINQKGIIIDKLEYETKGVLKGTIYANNQVTFYSIYGDYIARIAMFIAILFFIIGMAVQKKYKITNKD